MREPPLGHDPENPPWEDIESGPAEPVRDLPPIDEPIIAARRIFYNTAIPEPNSLQLTATETFTDADSDRYRRTVEELLLRLLDSFRVYFTTFDSGTATPAGVDFKYYDEEPSFEQEVRPPFANIFAIEVGSERLTTIELQLLAPRPQNGDPLVGVGATIHPTVYNGNLHGYVAKCTASAYASVTVYRGKVRLRIFKNGNSIDSVEASAGQTKGPIGDETKTKATFDVAVRGLYDPSSEYYLSLGWVRGKGGGC